jgi:hypothetical protein
MVRRKSLTAAENDFLVNKAVLGVRSGLYKSSYKAAQSVTTYCEFYNASRQWRLNALPSPPTTTETFAHTGKGTS